VAALGSYLDARAHGGRWLVRMEDLDAPRVIAGCAAQMLRTLESFALAWDGPVDYQSQHTDAYHHALQRLQAQGATFECSCTRAERQGEGGYAGTCRADGDPAARGQRRPCLRGPYPGQLLLQARRARGRDPATS
jgi:glutamyl-Q tRNA(Asp) synthetase